MHTTTSARLVLRRALVDLVIHKYAPLPSATLGQLARYLWLGGAPQLLAPLKQQLAHVREWGGKLVFPIPHLEVV